MLVTTDNRWFNVYLRIYIPSSSHKPCLRHCCRLVGLRFSLQVPFETRETSPSLSLRLLIFHLGLSVTRDQSGECLAVEYYEI